MEYLAIGISNDGDLFVTSDTVDVFDENDEPAITMQLRAKTHEDFTRILVVKDNQVVNDFNVEE